jgi:hypothetical protein
MWRNSDKRENLLNRIHSLKQQLDVQRNASQGPDSTLVAELMGKYFIDLVRLSDEMPDYTGVLTQIIDRPDMPKDVNLRDFLPYTGKERVIAGSNDSVPLIEERTAEITPIALELRAFGHKNSLWIVYTLYWLYSCLIIFNWIYILYGRKMSFFHYGYSSFTRSQGRSVDDL